MKDQIQKVLEMAKAGTLSDEQAAQLIEEIAHMEADTLRPAQTETKRGIIERVVEAVSGGHTSVVRGVLASELRENVFSMSHVDVRQNKDAVFQSNSIRMSRLGSVELTAGQLTENEMHSTSMENVAMRRSALTRSSFFASSLDNVGLDDMTLRDLLMRSSVWKNVELSASRFDDVAMHSVVLKQSTLGPNAEWLHTKLDSVEARDLTMMRSVFNDVAIEATRASGLTVSGTTLRMAMVRGYRWKDVRLVGSVFDDVLFSGDGNRKCVFSNVTFENCNFSRSIFSDTALTDTTIRNVTIDNVKAMGVVLNGKVIDGNEAFLEAVGIKPSATSLRVF